MNSQKVYYHVSPEASIQQFTPHYSPKLKMRGVYVSPTYRSLIADWALGYVFWKKHEGKHEHLHNVTIYRLGVPVEVANRVEKLWQDALDQAYEDQGFGVYGSWLWGKQYFIPEQDLGQIEIISRKTLTFHEILDIDNRHCGYRRHIFDCNLQKFATQVRLTNRAAKAYLDLLEAIREQALRDGLDEKQKEAIAKEMSGFKYLILDDKEDMRYTPAVRLDKTRAADLESLVSNVRRLLDGNQKGNTPRRRKKA